MFIGRTPGGAVYGAWSTLQPSDAAHSRIEEVSDNHPDLVAFKNRPLPAEALTAELLGRALKAKSLLTDSDIDAEMEKQP